MGSYPQRDDHIRAVKKISFIIWMNIAGGILLAVSIVAVQDPREGIESEADSNLKRRRNVLCIEVSDSISEVAGLRGDLQRLGGGDVGSRTPVANTSLSSELRQRIRNCEEVLKLQPRLVDGVSPPGNFVSILYSNIKYKSILEEGVGPSLASARAFFGLSSNTGGEALLSLEQIRDASAQARSLSEGSEQMFYLMGLAGIRRNDYSRDALISVVLRGSFEQTKVQCLAGLERYYKDDSVQEIARAFVNDGSRSVREKAKSIIRNYRAMAGK